MLEESQTEFIQFCDNQSYLIYIYEKLYAVILYFLHYFYCADLLILSEILIK